MKNIQFIINDMNNYFELWVNGECITDCFSMDGDGFDLMQQLVEFGGIPVFRIVNTKELQQLAWSPQSR